VLSEVKKSILLMLVCVLAALALPSLSAQVRVDAAGFMSDLDGTKKVPVWWKDGIPQILSAPENSLTNPVAISTDGKRVFITGTTGNAGEMARIPVLWVDGEYEEFPVLPGQEPGNTVPANTVLYQGNLYTGGTAANMVSAAPIFWWQDEARTRRPQLNVLPFHSTYGASIRTSFAGPDGVYFGGFTFTDTNVAKPCIWRVDMDANVIQPTILESDEDATTIVMGVYVTPDGAVHAAGLQQDGRQFTPLYWLNGKKKILQQIDGDASAEANGITVSNVGDVIISGWYQPNGNDPKAVTWVNGKMVILPSNRTGSMTHDVANGQGVVVVPGSEFEVGNPDTPVWPVFWVGKDRYALGMLADQEIGQPTAGMVILPADSLSKKK
jgi:hypothetical protein